MSPSQQYEVSVQRAAPRSIAAVRAVLPIRNVPAVFARYLDQVYAAARGGAVQLDGQNVFVYRDLPDRPGDAEVAFGVGVTAPFTAIGAVEPLSLPTGDVVTTAHWGRYSMLGAAHDAVIAWCRTRGHRRSGVRWEVYGHWTDDETQLRTDVFHLLDTVAGGDAES